VLAAAAEVVVSLVVYTLVDEADEADATAVADEADAAAVAVLEIAVSSEEPAGGATVALVYTLADEAAETAAVAVLGIAVLSEEPAGGAAIVFATQSTSPT